MCLLRLSQEKGIPITVLIVPFIAAPLQNSMRASVSTFQHLQGLKLAHPITNEENFQVSMLIGTDFYWRFIEDNIVRGDSPTAQQSKLGYLLSGPIHQATLQRTTANAFHIAVMNLSIEDPNPQQFWSLEETGTVQHTTQGVDRDFLYQYQTNNISQAKDGTYTARFPWKSDHPHLPSNFAVCEKRTRNLVSRLMETPSLLHLYNDIISDQEKRGFIERLSSDHQSKQAHYLPHHPVKKDSVTTPIRIVFDGSCRQGKGSASLNDCLLVGPPFLNDLCSILFRFRVPTFAFATDIEKGFLHVKLHKADTDFTCFLWLSDITNPAGELATYCFKVVPFGTTSSLFMLNATLDLHLSKFSSPVARITSLPHEHEENVDDPDYMGAPAMRKQVDRHSKILDHFQSRWKREYITSLREFYKASGHNKCKQLIKKGDVVLIHNDKPRLKWKLAVIEELLPGNDGLVRAANVRTDNFVTSRPISRLYPLEVSTTPSMQVEKDSNSVPASSKERPKRKAAGRARSQISEWTRDLRRPPEDVEN